MKPKYILQILFVIIIGISCTNNIENNTQETIPETSEDLELFKILSEKDSLLFQIGFNQIDTLVVASLISEDFEFYHDEHGITDSKAAFLNNIKSIRDLPFKTWRNLVAESMEIFPLYEQNSQVLYGAIQNGKHDFYQQIEGEAARKTNTAKFTHLWILEDSKWKLKRVLSFDHQVPKGNASDDEN